MAVFTDTDTRDDERAKKRGIIILIAAIVAVAFIVCLAVWGVRSLEDSHQKIAGEYVAEQSQSSSHAQSGNGGSEQSRTQKSQGSRKAQESDSQKEQKKGTWKKSQNSRKKSAKKRTYRHRRDGSQRGSGKVSPHHDGDTHPHEVKAADPVVWNYDNRAIKDTKNSIANDQVRQSPFYSVQLRNTDSAKTFNSFTYLSIPRGGLGKQGYTGEDGADFAYDNGFTMSWSSFVYSHDVWVNVSLQTGAKISRASDVTIRPTSLHFAKKLVNDHTVAIKVPFSQNGYRFSVEFASEQTKVYANGATGAVTAYNVTADKESKLNAAKDYIETEPRNSMMVFAQPRVEGTAEGAATIPTARDGVIQVIEPGEFPTHLRKDTEIIYLKAGVHWMGSRRQAELGPRVRWVYFEPGAFMKGAFYFTGSPTVTNYKMTGYGVLSTEQYGYETSTKNNFKHRPDSDSNCWDSCVKPMRFTSDAQQQTLDIQGVTVKEPSYHSFVMYAYKPADAVGTAAADSTSGSTSSVRKSHTLRPEGSEDTFALHVRNYQQVGAWYWQTDGLELYTGSTMKNSFIHSNDDVIKLYHSHVSVKNTVVWKNENGPVFQWGWVGRDIDNVTVENTDIIHSRMYWGGNDNMCVFNSAGDLWGGTHQESPSPSWMVQNMTIRNTRVEDTVNCGIRITSLGSMRNVTIDGFYVHAWTDQRADLQRSTFSVAKSASGKYGNVGDTGKANGLNIHNYFVGGQGVSFADENWQADQIGKLDFGKGLAGKWSLSYDGQAQGDKPQLSFDEFSDGQIVSSRDIELKGSATHAQSVQVDVNGKTSAAKVVNGKFVISLHLDKVTNTVRVVAQSSSGVKAAKYLTLIAYGSRIGGITDPQGDDNGPGSYVYPTNSSFAKGNFDMTQFDAYDDGDSYNFVTSLASPVYNPWGGRGISTQQVNIYLRDGKANDNDITALRQGTQTYVHGTWKYVVVVDGRYIPGVYTPRGKKIADVEISSVDNRITVSVPKSAFSGLDVGKAKYEVSMYSSSEGSEGIDNVRPVYSLSCWNGETASCPNFIKEYRFGGAKGNHKDDSPFITDTTASNAIDIISGDVQMNGTQAQIMSLNHDKIVVPYVTLHK
ncbi:glucodextranase DOMON-like domain-containing protein [Alloscardovia venturai]|uniref:Glucodextranase DOMON-like domain-containing protein n=1 Tax=Alloscardovia venturai TaxID=1769421 RepID=A0ABW2Y5L9_9BIFI